MFQNEGNCQGLLGVGGPRLHPACVLTSESPAVLWRLQETQDAWARNQGQFSTQSNSRS